MKQPLGNILNDKNVRPSPGSVGIKKRVDTAYNLPVTPKSMVKPQTTKARRPASKLSKPLAKIPFTIFEDPPSDTSPEFTITRRKNASDLENVERKPLSTITPFTIYQDSASKITPVQARGKSTGRTKPKPAALKVREIPKKTTSPGLTSNKLSVIPVNEDSSYWKNLAEDRRLALEAALLENKMLHDCMKSLKDENLHLMDAALQVDELSSLVAQLMDEKEAMKLEQ